MAPETQPPLPAHPDGAWPEATLAWWSMWADHPISAEFTSLDWGALASTALAHAAVWNGDLKHLSELRLREAKFGVTLEDRARLRITFAQADEADERRTKPAAGGARERRGPLTA